MSELSEKLKSFGRKSLNLFEYDSNLANRTTPDAEVIEESVPEQEVVVSEEPVTEAADAGIARLRVQISKLKNKLEKDPKNTKYNAQLASVVARKKNLEADARIRDVWAANAEASRKTED